LPSYLPVSNSYRARAVGVRQNPTANGVILFTS
jgi:hypothetical protein